MPVRQITWGGASSGRSSISHLSDAGSSDSKRSGVFAHSENEEDEESHKNDQFILENARIGMAEATLNPRAPRRRLSSGKIKRRKSSFRDWLSDVASDMRDGEWRKSLSVALIYMQLFDTVYILWSVPFRIGFLFDPLYHTASSIKWSDALTVFTTVDIMFGLIRINTARDELRIVVVRFLRIVLRRCMRRVHHDLPRLMSALRNSINRDLDSYGSQWSGMSSRADRVMSADTMTFRLGMRSRGGSQLGSVLSVINCFPWELIVVFIDYNTLHAIGLCRYIQAILRTSQHFSAALNRHRKHRIAQFISFSASGTISFLFISGMYICHLAATGYMLVAHCECGLHFDRCTHSPIPGSWVIKDKLQQGTLWRKYIRSLYWGCKTVTTLGQGDLVPATNAETFYRIVIQFVGGLWATAILTAYSFYFSRKDVQMPTNLTTRLEQATNFIKTRKLAPQLATGVRSYFLYMQRTRSGVEEELILESLPQHYRLQCEMFVRYKSLQRIALFRNREGAFLRAILSSLVKDYYSPNQVLIQAGDLEEMTIIAAGEVRIVDEDLAVRGRLTTGNAYAERALFAKYTSPFTLAADSYCEVWILYRRLFKIALRKHLSRMKSALILAKRFQVNETNHQPPMAGPSEKTVKAASPVGFKRGSTNKHIQLLTADTTASLRGIDSWRLPSSRFRKFWARVECVLLVFLLFEVPYQIAFQRGFGALNDASVPTVGAIPMIFQQFNFGAAMIVEIFFYVDWYFRVRCFVCFADSSSGKEDWNALISEHEEIFRRYKELGDLWMDILANAPIALGWDIVPKVGIVGEVAYYARFVRLTRLVRLRKLHNKLRTIMLDHGIAPTNRMLLYVVIFCTASAHIAACTFFLIGDFRGFQGGLPVHGTPHDSITPFECLEDATLYDNCTWYMHDRSVFNIDAPYLRSFQWSIVLLSTVGYGEIVSLTTRETVMGCLWIFLGANICYFTGSVLTSALAQIGILRSIRQERVEEINLALTSMSDVSEDTKVMIRAYYSTKWRLNGSAMDNEELFAHLPRSIRRHVRSSLYTADLCSCRVFSTYSRTSAFIKDLAQIVRSDIFLKGFMVVNEGLTATEFFVIQTGKVELLLPPLKSAFGILSTSSDPGSVFDVYRRKGPKITNWRGWTDRASIGVAAAIHRHSVTRSSKATRSSLRDFTIQSRHSLTSFQSFQGNERNGRSSLVGLLIPRLRRRTSFEERMPWGEGLIPVSVLNKHDFFGQESISCWEGRTYQVNVRVISSAQVAIIRRSDFLNMVPRFPKECGEIFDLLNSKAERDETLLKALRVNFMFRDKVTRRLGITQSLFADDSSDHTDKKWLRPLDPEGAFVKWWHRGTGMILVYNFYVIIFRMAFVPRPQRLNMWIFTGIDYLCDLILYIDIVLKLRWLGYSEHGQKVLDPARIRKRYVDGYFVQDCCSMIPIYYYGDYLGMTLARLPRMLRSPQLITLLDEIQTHIQEHLLRGNTRLSSVFDLCKFILIFVSTAHYLGSLYYLLGKYQLEFGIVEHSWVNMDLILRQYPNNVPVHYMRAMYWCLSTFTVDCFGDILARNFLETVFSGCTCILGWIFVGQVIGRINMLMITLNKDAKLQAMRIEAFDQFAKQRKLPTKLRHRGLESLTYKSECLVELRTAETFRDLPTALRARLFDEMYSPLLMQLPEFKQLSRAQVNAIASAMYLEIYLHGDVIYERGRMGTKLYVLKKGCAEMFSPYSRTVFAALHEGSLFGEFAFFMPGARRLASVRAIRSCQVLQLDRKAWIRIWPEAVRNEVEAVVLPIVKKHYERAAMAFLNITKNFYIKNDKSKPPKSASQKHRLLRRTLTPIRIITATDPSVASSMGRRRMTLTPRGSFNVQPDSVGRRSSSASIDLTQAIAAGLSVVSGPTSPRKSLANILDVPQELANDGEIATVKRKSSLKVLKEALGLRENTLRTTVKQVMPLLQTLDGSLTLVRQDSNSSRKSVLSVTDATAKLTRRDSNSSATSGRLRRRDSNLARPVSDANTRLIRRDSNSSATSGRLRRRDSNLARPVSDANTRLIRRDSNSSATSGRLRRRDSNLARCLLPRLTSFTEFRWKAHEKRLAALRMFAVGCSRINEDLKYPDELSPRSPLLTRRASIMALPSFESLLGKRKLRLQLEAIPRRYSIDPTKTHIRLEFEGYQGFEVGVATLEGHSHTPKHGSDVVADDSGSEGEVEPPVEDKNTDNITTFSLRALWRAWRKPKPKPEPMRRMSKIAPSADPNTMVYQIWVPPPVVSDVFREDSGFRNKWDIAMLFVTLYYIFVIPFRVCFLYDHLDDPKYVTIVIASYVFEYLFTDMVCVIDFFFRRNFFVYLNGGEAVADKEAIKRHYWEEGSYLIDFISLIPFEILGLVVVGAAPSHFKESPEMPFPIWRVLAITRLNRFLRGVHFHSLSDRVQRFLLYEAKISRLQPGSCYLFRLAVDFALGSHWVACLFFGVSFFMYDESRPSWLTAPGMLVFEGCRNLSDVSHLPLYVKYVRSFHFSIGAITTVCYGDIIPMNAVENVTTMVVIFLSVGFFSMLSGGFFKYYEMDLGKRADYEEKMQVYFALRWQESKGMQEEEMLQGLTSSVRDEIVVHVHANLLKHVKLLQSCEPCFARALVTVLQHELFVRNDVIIQRGDLGRSMYIIESGIVSIRRTQKRFSTTNQRKTSAVSSKVEKESAPSMPQTTTSRLRRSFLLKDPKALVLPQPLAVAPVDTTEMPGRVATTANLFPVVTPASAPVTSGVSPHQANAFSIASVVKAATKEGKMVKFVKGPFDYFGERSLLFGTPRNATCVALCVCSVYVLTLEKYDEILAEFPMYRRKNIQDWVIDRLAPSSPGKP